MLKVLVFRQLKYLNKYDNKIFRLEFRIVYLKNLILTDTNKNAKQKNLTQTKNLITILQ